MVICALVFIVFCIVCTVFFYCFFYVYLFLFVLSVLPPNDNSIAVSHNNNNNIIIIKMGLQEVGCGDLDWIELAQNRDRWPVLVNVVMNFRVP